MSYIINNSRGNVIAIVPDGTVNTTATDLALVGRAVTGYGTYENENYVYLLENFAKPTAPVQPLLGQLWYNSVTDTLSVYNTANTWSALAPIVSPSFTGIPTAPTAANGTSSVQIATTAYVQNQLNSSSGITSLGNITGGNLLTSGMVSAGGNVIGANVLTVGMVSAVGNVIGGNLLTSGMVSTVGNVTGANLITAGSVSAVGNSIAANFLANTVSVTGNITGGNVRTNGTVSVTGMMISGNVTTTNIVGSSVSVTGNITGGTVTTNNFLGSSVSVSGNITGGNVVAANFVGNISIPLGGVVSTTGNIVGGNLFSSNLISAAGNVVATDTVFANTVIANNLSVVGSSNAFRLPNLTQSQIDALTPQNGDIVFNTTTNLPQIFQIGTWKNFTISYYA